VSVLLRAEARSGQQVTQTTRGPQRRADYGDQQEPQRDEGGESETCREERVACGAGREGERQRPHEAAPFRRGLTPERVDLRPFETKGEPSTESNRTRDREQEREDAREQRRRWGVGRSPTRASRSLTRQEDKESDVAEGCRDARPDTGNRRGSCPERGEGLGELFVGCEAALQVLGRESVGSRRQAPAARPGRGRPGAEAPRT
jgi:hypothetical protein